MKRFFLTTVIFLLLSMLMGDILFAIPSFARKYNMTCKTCHTPFPKLKPYAEDFAADGFVLKDKEAPRYFLDTGDDELSLLRELPIAIKLEAYLTYNNSHQKQSDITSPYVIKLLSGGEITKNISYYFYFFFSERGEVAGLEDAFVMFNNLFDTEIDLFVGQFQASDPLFKRELRLTFEDYQIYKTKIGNSRINLAYDRGIMLTYGLPTGTDLTLEILNGNGIDKANNFRNFDDDKYKNLLGRLSQDITKNIRLGALGYFGKEALSLYENELNMFGVDATINLETVELNLQYLQREDKNPYDLINPQKVNSKGIMAELIYLPHGDDSKLYFTGLFNWMELDKVNTYKTATLNLGYMLKRNVRVLSEYTYDLKWKFGKLSIGLVAAY